MWPIRGTSDSATPDRMVGKTVAMEDVSICVGTGRHTGGHSTVCCINARTWMSGSVRCRPASTASMVSVVSAAPDGELGWTWRCGSTVIAGAGVDRGGWIRLEDGDQVVTYTPGNGAVTSVEPPAQRWVSMPSMLWRPRPLIGAIEIASVNDGFDSGSAVRGRSQPRVISPVIR